MSVIENYEKYKKVYLFGHCDATIKLANLLIKSGIQPIAILDNNKEKYGITYKRIPVVSPAFIMYDNADDTAVFIVHRAYEAMKKQLRELGFVGEVFKIAEYNTFAEYSLSDETVHNKQQRLMRGIKILEELRRKYVGSYFVFCPFNALGDVYLCMSYLPQYMNKEHIERCVICVTGNSVGEVALLFGDYDIELFGQNELDCAMQACIKENATDTFIAHQDRPYVINLNKALYQKAIPFEKIYCCGVFGLSYDTEAARPKNWKEYNGAIESGKTVIIAPYAKSVPEIDSCIWNEIVCTYVKSGYKVYTNVQGNELPLEGTTGISPKISEMKSLVEKAGIFIGIRSGLCDILREAKAKKIALYPDYNYCDTKWKAIDIYYIEQFEYNLLETEDIRWEKL